MEIKLRKILFITFGILILIASGVLIYIEMENQNDLELLPKNLPSKLLSSSFDPSDTREIGFEYLTHQGNITTNESEAEVVHTWSNFSDYYFNKSSGIQFTNVYDDYWTRNIFCGGYKNASNDWVYKCNDEFNFNQNITTDNSTYVNYTLWKDFSIGSKDVRFVIRYHLKTNDKNLTIQFQIENIGSENINTDLGFAWRTTDINIGNNAIDDYIFVNGSTFALNETRDESYSNLDFAYYKLYDAGSDMWLKWNENLTYALVVKSKENQTNAPVTLGINIGNLNIGQEKQTEMFWQDARQLTSVSITSPSNDTSVNSGNTFTYSCLNDYGGGSPSGTTGDGNWTYCAGAGCDPTTALTTGTTDLTGDDADGQFTNPGTSDYTASQTITGNTDGEYWLKCFSTDQDGPVLESGLFKVTVAFVDNPPQWSEDQTNSTFAGEYILHSVNWSDDFDTSGYIFEFDNGTGTFVNDSFVEFGATNWSNVTKYVNETVGSIIRWRVYANDSANQFNSTDIFSYSDIFFWITSLDDDEVYRFFFNGTTAGSFDTATHGSSNPHGLCTNNTFIWVVDLADTLVYKYFMNGTFTEDTFNVSSALGSSTLLTGVKDCTLTNTYLYVDSSGVVEKFFINGTYEGSSFTLLSTDVSWIETNETFFWGSRNLFPGGNISRYNTTSPEWGFESTFDLSGTETNEAGGIYWKDGFLYVNDFGTGTEVNKYFDNGTFSNQQFSHSIAGSRGMTGTFVPSGSPDNPPQWSENLTNSTTAGEFILHSVKWTDETALSGYIFEFDNGTIGSLVNDSFVLMTGVNNYSNVTKVINTTIGAFVQWRVYANDSSNNLNSTDIFQYITTSEDSCTYSGSGNFEVSCSDNCNITSNVVGDGNDLILSGSGNFNVEANITNFKEVHKDNSCFVIKSNDAQMELTN